MCQKTVKRARRRRANAIIGDVRKENKKARQYLARRVAELRAERGWSQEMLSTKAGLHRSYVWVIEETRKGAGIDVIGDICEALGCTVEDLFDSDFHLRESK